MRHISQFVTVCPEVKLVNPEAVPKKPLVLNPIRSPLGATNSITNIAIVDFSNYVAAATVNYPVLATLTAPTNQTIVLQSQTLFFNNGVWATNLGSGNATLTLNYSKP